jgi:flagellar biosynthesis protein FliQ
LSVEEFELFLQEETLMRIPKIKIVYFISKILAFQFMLSKIYMHFSSQMVKKWIFSFAAKSLLKQRSILST